MVQNNKYKWTENIERVNDLVGADVSKDHLKVAIVEQLNQELDANLTNDVVDVNITDDSITAEVSSSVDVTDRSSRDLGAVDLSQINDTVDIASLNDTVDVSDRSTRDLGSIDVTNLNDTVDIASITDTVDIANLNDTVDISDRSARDLGSVDISQVNETVTVEHTDSQATSSDTIDTSTESNNPFTRAITLPTDTYEMVTVHARNAPSSSGNIELEVLSVATGSPAVIHPDDGTEVTLSPDEATVMSTFHLVDQDDLQVRIDDLGNTATVDIEVIAKY